MEKRKPMSGSGPRSKPARLRALITPLSIRSCTGGRNEGVAWRIAAASLMLLGILAFVNAKLEVCHFRQV